MITFDPAIIRAAVKCAAVRDCRKYLNGVRVEVRPNGVFAIGTDGHRLFAAADLSLAPDPVWHGRAFTIARDDVKKLKGASSVSIRFAKLPADGEPGHWEITTPRHGMRLETFGTLEGRFPDWERVVPSAPSGEVAQYQPQFLADLADAFRELGGQFPHLFHNGNGPGLMIAGGISAVGVVMPYHSKVSALDLDWLRCRAPELEAAA